MNNIMWSAGVGLRSESGNEEGADGPEDELMNWIKELKEGRVGKFIIYGDSGANND